MPDRPSRARRGAVVIGLLIGVGLAALLLSVEPLTDPADAAEPAWILPDVHGTGQPDAPFTVGLMDLDGQPILPPAFTDIHVVPALGDHDWDRPPLDITEVSSGHMHGLARLPYTGPARWVITNRPVERWTVRGRWPYVQKRGVTERCLYDSSGQLLVRGVSAHVNSPDHGDVIIRDGDDLVMPTATGLQRVRVAPETVKAIRDDMNFAFETLVLTTAGTLLRNRNAQGRRPDNLDRETPLLYDLAGHELLRGAYAVHGLDGRIIVQQTEDRNNDRSDHHPDGSIWQDEPTLMPPRPYVRIETDTRSLVMSYEGSELDLGRSLNLSVTEQQDLDAAVWDAGSTRISQIGDGDGARFYVCDFGRMRVYDSQLRLLRETAIERPPRYPARIIGDQGHLLFRSSPAKKRYPTYDLVTPDGQTIAEDIRYAESLGGPIYVTDSQSLTDTRDGYGVSGSVVGPYGLASASIYTDGRLLAPDGRWIAVLDGRAAFRHHGSVSVFPLPPEKDRAPVVDQIGVVDENGDWLYQHTVLPDQPNFFTIIEPLERPGTPGHIVYISDDGIQIDDGPTMPGNELLFGRRHFKRVGRYVIPQLYLDDIDAYFGSFGGVYDLQEKRWLPGVARAEILNDRVIFVETHQMQQGFLRTDGHWLWRSTRYRDKAE